MTGALALWGPVPCPSAPWPWVASPLCPLVSAGPLLPSMAYPLAVLGVKGFQQLGWWGCCTGQGRL